MKTFLKNFECVPARLQSSRVHQIFTILMLLLQSIQIEFEVPKAHSSQRFELCWFQIISEALNYRFVDRSNVRR